VDADLDNFATRFWLSADYLLWWTKGEQLPALLTAGSSKDTVPGALGQPGTQVLFGGEVNDEVRSGARFRGGYWFTRDQTFGMDGTFFFLGGQSTHFSDASEGLPMRARPFFNVNSNKEDASPVAFPGHQAGSFVGSVSSFLWGADTNLRGMLFRGPSYQVSLLGGFSMNAMIWYLAVAETIATSIPPLTRRIDEDVRSGRLAYLLSRPNSYVLYNFAQYLGERLVRFCINGVVAACMALLLVGPPHFTWLGVLAWPFVTFLALCIDFVAYFAIGLLAFWTEDTNSFNIIYSRLTLVLGGVLVPLEVFPQPLRGIAQALPFSAILYGPARTLVHFDLGSFGRLLLQQGVTLGVGCLILGAIYRVAIRRVNINGG